MTQTQLMQIPDSIKGTKETLIIMRDFIRAYMSNYSIIELSRYLVALLPQKDFFNEARLIQEFVRDQIRYIQDPRNLETIATPIKTLDIGQGDCDDKSVLVATMLESIGFKTKIVALAFKNRPFFSHVLIEVFINNEWIAVETTEPVKIGWYPPDITKKMSVYV